MMANQYDDHPPDLTPPAFVLTPLNSAARKATEHVRNKYWQFLDQGGNTFGLWIDFSDPQRQAYTLGHNDTDIYLPETRGSKSSLQISDLQASFQLVPDTGAVILYDHSEHANTEPFAPSSSGSSSSHSGVVVKFRSNARSVLVARGINSRIAFGRDKFYQFEIQWRYDGLYKFNKDEPYTLGPRHSRNKKYLQGEKVGGGAYGAVWWVMDITNGSLMAVKKFHSLSGKNLEFATREVANLFRINKDKSIHHEHILQIIDYAGGGADDNWGEIFMPLKAGNLKTLVEKTVGLDIASVADTVLRQMLLALECIASHDIVHRDIKPENILWEYDENGQYHFCLGDFGLSNDPKLARTVAGTEPFMAPEVFHKKSQSTKVDIWSLFATVVWVHNTLGFRQGCSQYGASQIHEWLIDISALPEYASIRRMASRSAKNRPSASQQLAILESGVIEDFVPEPPGLDYDQELDDQFRGMNLGEGRFGGYGQDTGATDSTDSANAPDVPYYEPYTSGLYPPQWGDSDQAGPSHMYMPPGHDNPPRDQQAYVATYGSPYGPVGDGSGSSTQVPSMWTARPMATEEEPALKEREKEARQKQKGKHRS